MKTNESAVNFGSAISDLPPFERILVLGCGGSGKSTLASELGKISSLPVIHLDRLFWLPGWKHRSREEFDRILADELSKEKWIIDGDYDRTLSERLKWCDAVILLDYPGILCVSGVIKRRMQHSGRSRASMADGCPERLDGQFVRWIMNYRRSVRPRHLDLLRQAVSRETPPRVYIMKNRNQTRRWLKAVDRAFNRHASPKS